MALLRKLFYKKPPDGLLQISERVYVFDCCFTTDAWGQEDYKGYVGNTISQLKDHYPDASILVFNFGEVESRKIDSALSEYDMTIMDYPRQYEGCPLLPMEVIHHFLRSSESWLSLGQQNILLMHCEQGGWPVLACMLAALLIYRKQYSGEYKTLDMVYKQAPRQLLRFFTPLNPLPSQLRYLQYISREWPPLDRALTLDCVIIRMIPDFDGNGGCCPIFRIYGQDPFFPGDKTPRLLFSTPKGSKNVRYYKKAESELVKIYINCHVQGDVVLECISLHDDLTCEKMMYRSVFNTSFIRSNNLMLTRDEIDILWDAKELFPKDFRAELLFSDMDAAASPTLPLDLSYFEEEGLPIEAFAKVQEMFSSVDCLSPNSDASDVVHKKLETGHRQSVEANNLLQQKEKSPTSSDTDAGGQKLPSPVPLKSPSSPPLAPLETTAMDQQSSSCPLSQPSPPTLPLKNLVCSKGQSHLPSNEQSQEVADNEVKPTPTPFPPSMLPPTPSLKDTKVEFSQLPPTQTAPETPPSGNLTNSPFPPFILHSSKLKRDKTDSKVEPSQSLSSLTPPATLLKDKRDNVLEPSPPPPPPPPPLKDKPVTRSRLSPPPPLPPPPPVKGGQERVASRSPVPPPPRISSGPPPPPPPTFSNGNVKIGVAPPPPPSLPRSGNNPGAPSLPPPLTKGCGGLSRAGSLKNQQSKKLKPLHWFKLTRALQGSLWAETQQPGEAAKAPEIDISELESLFSAANLKPKPEQGADKPKSRAAVANKPEKIQLINHKRAYNCEIMFSKVKIPLNELMDYVLALEESAMDADQVESLIKFCPTKEEMELLKNYEGETDKLGKCEQIFLELMKVPRTESKLTVFSFKLQFSAQVSDLRKSLNTINSAVEQTRGSAKLKRVMQTILSLGNALNQGTARGSAIGFRLDSLLKLTETRARNNRMTLMHYLCKVLGDKLPEVVDFSKDLGSLEPAAKMQLKYLAEEMQAISNGLKKAVEELSMAEYDGPVSDNFRKALEGFLCSADGEVRSLKSLDSMVRKNVDALILYFGEDPARCSYEQVVSTLLKFVRMFNQANEENAKQIEVEKKKAEKEASNEKLKQEHLPQTPVKSGN